MALISRKKTERRAWSADPVSCVGHQADISSPPLPPRLETWKTPSESGRAPEQTRVNPVLRRQRQSSFSGFAASFKVVKQAKQCLKVNSSQEGHKEKTFS